MRKIFVINGPNLNLLGTREPDVYGSTTLRQIVQMLKAEARKRGVRIGAYQSNHEGSIIDVIQRLPVKGYSGLIINPGAFTHYSYAIRDAIKATGLPTVEVHLSDIEKREEFRKISVIREVCMDQVKGLGPQGYVKALELLAEE
ncbi:MAG: type II 3-dehydroquinate dehydratase [Spirochaetes bacterium]|nr:type II 3-dehydroquinate dehydratase [Spirochaetota bacterium]